jgi:hypothetical protein
VARDPRLKRSIRAGCFWELVRQLQGADVATTHLCVLPEQQIKGDPAGFRRGNSQKQSRDPSVAIDEGVSSEETLQEDGRTSSEPNCIKIVDSGWRSAEHCGAKLIDLPYDFICHGSGAPVFALAAEKSGFPAGSKPASKTETGIREQRPVRTHEPFTELLRATRKTERLCNPSRRHEISAYLRVDPADDIKANRLSAYRREQLDKRAIDLLT